MKSTWLPKRITLVISCIIICVFIFNRCLTKDQRPAVAIRNSKGELFAGSANCRNCHQAIYDSFSTISGRKNSFLI